MITKGETFFGEILWKINISWLQNTSNLLENENIFWIVKNFYTFESPIFFIPIFLVCFWLFYSFKKIDLKSEELGKRKLLGIFYASVFSIIIAGIFKFFIFFERPENFIQNKDFLILDHEADPSFPSDHASVGSSFLFALAFFGYKKTFFCYLPFVFVMFLSRIMVGVHFPFDILAGVFVGILSAFISYQITYKSKLVEKFNTFLINNLQKIKL